MNMYGNFGPTTTNMKQQFGNNINTFSNFTESFNRNRPLIDAPDFKNRGEVLHNNLNDNLNLERVVEYRIQINSSDRDPSVTPNPFNMTVSMGNSANSLPNIKRKFDHIKYVTLNSVILPRTIAIDTSKINPDVTGPPPYDIYPTLSPVTLPLPAPPSTILHNLEYQPFLYLRVKELETQNSIGSNPLMDLNTFMLIPDQKLGDMYLWKPRRSMVVYPNSKYANISQLTLTILDQCGETLTLYDQTGKNIIRKPLGSAVQEDYVSYVEKYKYDNKNVKYTNNVTQVIYDFTFGIVENELNTQPNFN